MTDRIKLLFCLVSLCVIVAGCTTTPTAEVIPTTEQVSSDQKAGLTEPPTPQSATDGLQNLKMPDGTRLFGMQTNGKREGLWTSYFPNGKVKSTSVFVEGVRNGMNEVFFENGALFYKGNFKDNIRIGEWNFYNNEGKLEKTVVFDAKGEELEP